MKIISSFKPAISHRELFKVLWRMLSEKNLSRHINKFEDEFAKYLDTKYAIGAPSGRWGLYYILKNLNLREGDEVILPAFTYFAVPAVIVKLGLKPVFVDINSQDFNINVQKIKESITKRTRVIIPTHLYGFVCELEKILDMGREYDIKIIEDCAQSLGAEYKGRKTGSLGEASYFTFGITKNFTTLGGGMIATNNGELADKIRQEIITIRKTDNRVLFLRLLKAYIMRCATSRAIFPAIYCVIRLFSCFGLDIVGCIFGERDTLLDSLPESGQINDIQAEFGILQLNCIDEKNITRMEKGNRLYERLRTVSNIKVPLLEEKEKNIFSGCPVIVNKREYLKRNLLKRGIDTSAGYIQNCSRLDIFKEFEKDCPNASKAEDGILHLPIYPELSDGELAYIAEIVKQVVYDK